MQGQTSQKQVRFHQTGTLARIVDFDQLDDGFLGITCRGGRTFKVLRHTLNDDQLIHANIEILTESAADPQTLPEGFLSMREFLYALMERDELTEYAKAMIPEWDNPNWLSCRLSELLPLSMESRQILLELPVTERLTQLSSVMRENKLI